MISYVCNRSIAYRQLSEVPGGADCLSHSPFFPGRRFARICHRDLLHADASRSGRGEPCCSAVATDEWTFGRK